jgi:hypothetical protein
MELALLCLRDLEPKVGENPELLVSTEAVLALAAVRQADPFIWQHWRRILEKYGKAELIEHMLGEPVLIDRGEDRSVAYPLIRLVLESGIELFHDPDEHAWACVRVDDHWENHPIRSRRFQRFLLRTYYQETGTTPGAPAIRAAMDLFEAKALFDGEEFSVNLRVADHNGKLYLDLCDQVWRVVEISGDGWRITDRPPVKFHRTRGSQPLPIPERGGNIEELRGFLNVDHQGWTLIRAFLVAALRPGVPCPILVVKGEQGAGKTTACRIISELIDPRTAALRGVPREVRDLTAAAKNSWLVCFDNLSHLPDELADAACRLATGGGFGGRELYSDHDEAIFKATRPMVFNAIPDLGVARSDFLDRILTVQFLSIKPDMRRDERQFWREFEKARPRILGSLLDVAAGGIKSLCNIRVDQLPRMADFAVWIAACEDALGNKSGEALTIYQSNRAEVHHLALESSLLYQPLLNLARQGFSGTTTELFARLNSVVDANIRRSVRWPKAPSALGGALRRLASNLRAVGIQIEFSRADVRGRRVVSLVTDSELTKTQSAAVSSCQ